MTPALPINAPRGLIRVRPPAPGLPTPASAPPILPSKNPGADFFDETKVVRPGRFDPEEAKVAAELRGRIVEWQGADNEFLRNSEVEFDFLSGNHWVDEVVGQDRRKQLQSEGRSAFTIDLLTPSVEIIVNQIRINKTSASFVPMSQGANAATAEIRQGLYRNIDRESKAAIARETAYYMATAVGRGYYRVLIEDDDGPTFTRHIAIKRIDNLYSVAIDPTCVDFCYADAAWAYTFDDLWKDQFRAEHGGTDSDGIEIDLDTQGLALDEGGKAFWFPKDKVKVGEYWRRCWKRRVVWKLSDGTVCWKDEAPEGVNPKTDVVREKVKMDDYLEWRKMTGSQTLEKRIWPGKLIPIVVVVGRELFRGKKPKINSGMVRPAMDPLKINNYMTSRMVDEVGLSPLPHLFSAVGHLSPEQKNIVNEINKHPWSNVEYTPQEDNQGRALPPPMWSSPSPNTAAVVQAEASAKDNAMRVLNTFAPQLGAIQGQQSGTAINQVKEQGDISHAAFPDNFNRALLHEAAIVNELMDVVYTEPQAIAITQPDESTVQVLINQEFTDRKTGKKQLHLFGAGKYGVVTTTGAAYPTRVAEGVQRILDLIKTMAPPEIVKILDLVVKDLNLPNWQKYADRLRPPGFEDPDELPDQQTLMQHVIQMEQNAQQADQLIQKLLAKVQELGSQEAIKRLEIASKERMNAANNAAGVVEAEVKATGDAAHAVLMAQLEGILKQLDTAEDVNQQTGPTASPSTAPPAAGPAPTPPQGGVPTGLGAPPPSGGPLPGSTPVPGVGQ